MNPAIFLPCFSQGKNYKNPSRDYFLVLSLKEEPFYCLKNERKQKEKYNMHWKPPKMFNCKLEKLTCTENVFMLSK